MAACLHKADARQNPVQVCTAPYTVSLYIAARGDAAQVRISPKIVVREAI
jgi:hypothetical protein